MRPDVLARVRWSDLADGTGSRRCHLQYYRPSLFGLDTQRPQVLKTSHGCDDPIVTQRTNLDAWFIHTKLSLNLLDPRAAQSVQSGLPDPSHPMWRSYFGHLMEAALADAFVEMKPASLAVAHAEGMLAIGQLVWIEQRFYFKGVDLALREVSSGRPGRASFRAPLSTDPTLTVSGTYSAEHLTSNTSSEALRGSSRRFVLGYVQELEAREVQIRPILIADRWGAGITKPGFGFVETEPTRAWPSDVDQFEGVDWAVRLRPADLAVLKAVSEEQTKTWLAEILGEPEVPKDWGGEQYDLWTDRITLNGKHVQAAIALKGPAKFHPMTVADLGKNGDQISRLAQTAADLLVVQHCHAVTAQVVHVLHAYAANPANPRRYLVIDGYDTVRILRHFGHLA